MGRFKEDPSSCQGSSSLNLLHQEQTDEKHPGAGEARAQEAVQERGDGDGGRVQLYRQAQLPGVAVSVSEAAVPDLVDVQDGLHDQPPHRGHAAQDTLDVHQVGRYGNKTTSSLWWKESGKRYIFSVAKRL